jgi:hypothetical protein
MFKTFAPAALAAIAAARGTDSGADRENATEQVLLDRAGAKITLFTYNADNAGINEFHGDITLEVTSDATNKFTIWQEYGFCMQFPDTEAAAVINKWDCMQVRASLDPAKINDTADVIAADTYNTDFEIIDGYWSGNALFGITGPTPDANWSTQNDAAKNWRTIPSKSSKACTLQSTSGTNKVITCTGVNAHWYRNFETDSATEDNQLTVTDPTATVNVLGFRTQFTADTWKNTSAYVAGDVIKVTPVKQAYLDAKAAADAAAADTNKDGATSLTTYAAAIVAAVYALAF